MPAIQINDSLSIDTGDPRGTLITYFSGRDTGMMDIFNVALFFSSVKSMLESLKQGQPWKSDDNSLVVSGDSEEITLTFKMQAPPFGEVDVELHENDSKKFMDEMEKIVEGN